MKFDPCGVAYASCDELCDMLYKKPDLDISRISVTDPEKYNTAVDTLFADLPRLQLYNSAGTDQTKFDHTMQEHWHMPDEYKNFDIASWVLSKCNTDPELQRAGHELLLFQERELFDLLRYLKYLVDIMRQHNIVWGVGRGSSVSSFVLYILGVHKINSLYYDLDPTEFLK